MPASVVKTKKDEEHWKRAKEIAADQGQKDNYAYIMGIFKKMSGKKSEAIIRKFAIRGGKKVKIKTSNKPGYKIVGGKEVRMSPKEIRSRKISAKKAARKLKSKSKSIARKRQRSTKKHTWESSASIATPYKKLFD